MGNFWIWFTGRNRHFDDYKPVVEETFLDKIDRRPDCVVHGGDRIAEERELVQISLPKDFVNVDDLDSTIEQALELFLYGPDDNRGKTLRID